MAREKSFEYPLTQGGVKDKSYIKVVDWVADKTSETLAETGRITVVAHDNRVTTENEKNRTLRKKIGRNSTI